MAFEIVFVSLLLVALGLAFCFAGYRLFTLILPVWGFFAGFLVTAQVIQEVFGGGFLATTSSWLFGFFVGGLCALAAYYVFVAAVAVLAAAVGYELGVGLMTGWGVGSGAMQFLLGLVLAVALVAAAIVFNLPKVFLILLTAEAGASMLLTGLLLALGHVSLADLQWGLVGSFLHASWLWFLLFVVIMAAGIAVQMLLPEGVALETYTRQGSLRQKPTASAPASPSEATPRG